MGKTEIIAETGTQTIDVTREFAAPRELVFRAFTDPELLCQWMGGRKYPMTVHTLEPRDGGRWRYSHRMDDGVEFAFRGVFHGDPSPDGTTQTWEYEGDPGNISLESMALEERGGKTLMRMHTVYQTEAARNAMIASGMEEGMNGGLDLLDEVLAGLVAKT